MSENPGSADRDAGYAPVEPREAFRWGESSSVQGNGFGEHVSRQPSNGPAPATPSDSPLAERPTFEIKLARFEAAEAPAAVPQDAGDAREPREVAGWGDRPGEASAPSVSDVHPDSFAAEPVSPVVRLEPVAEPTEVELEPVNAEDPVAEPRIEAPWWERPSAVVPTPFEEGDPGEPSVSQTDWIASDPEDTVDVEPTGLEVVGDSTEPERQAVGAGDPPLPTEGQRPNPPASAEYVAAPEIRRSSGSTRVAVVGLAALMGLVAALAGRHLRRHQ